MYHSNSYLADADDKVSAFMSGNIPLVEIQSDSGRMCIHVPHTYPNESIVWLRRLAEQASSLAEVIEAAHVNDEAGIGETYTCGGCGQRFGIAGENTGTPEDDAADEYFTEQVEYHQRRECTTEVAR